MAVVTMRLAADFRTHGHLLACRDHALAGMPLILDTIGLHPGATQRLGHLAPIVTLDPPTIAQLRDELILEKRYACSNCHD